MAFEVQWDELAKMRIEDLRQEVCRSRRRRTRVADGRQASALHSRIEQLGHWFQQGQIGTGIDDVSDAPITARGRCA